MRFDKRLPQFNGEELYKEHFQKRGVKFIEHYGTAKFNYPDSNGLHNLATIPYVWKLGDKYYKLAAYYYSEPKLWWVIAWFNKAPTEAHLKVGDLIQMPTPVSEALMHFGVYY